MKINKHIFSIVFLAVATIALSLPGTASAQITPQQCMDNYSGGICKDDPWFGSACGSDETDRGACTLSGTKCCSKISNMTQLTRDQCQANAGSNCVQGSCPSGSTTLGVCSDVANYLCCSSAYTNPINSDPSVGGTSTLNNGPFNYTLLERIPGGENAGSDLETYVENIYRIALIIVTLSAVLMLSIGGFMYLTSAGNTSAMGSAKSVIFDSLIGLVIAIVAWLILNVINPDLVNVTLNGFSTTPVSSGTPATTTTTPGTGTTTPAPATGTAWPSDASERGQLASSISVNVANCTSIGQTACTSLAGSAAISAVNALAAACGNCSIVISGGTECWLHDKTATTTCYGAKTHHRPGDYALDLKHGAVDSYITSNGTVLCSLNNRPVYKIGNAVYWDEAANHWHVNFNKSVCTGI